MKEEHLLYQDGEPIATIEIQNDRITKCLPLNVELKDRILGKKDTEAESRTAGI